MNRKLLVEEEIGEDEDLEVSGVKKKEKKRKSKEEKGKDRKVVFWMMVFILLITASFWLKAVWEGKEVKTQKLENSKNQNYEETEGSSGEEKGFFVKYKI
ncbi:MAG: hypothetical protein ACD_57C00090G0002 [uncultured bacterium]|nr:MAG: hypothetical protein ACD_57C00090G0002 [uncultured bacterium]